MQQKLAEKEKLAKEDHLREMARKAREERQNANSARRDSGSRRRSRSYSASSYDSRSQDGSEDEAARDRELARKERREENERKLRQSRMGTEKRIQMMARDQNRDISEKVALGLAKPTQNKETMYDSRLFNQTSGFDSGFNEDQHYDKPLFAAQDAINSIYRPTTTQDDDDGGEEAADAAMSKIQKSNRFDSLGTSKNFKGTELAERHEGPVQFEKDKDDPFGIDTLIGEASARHEQGENKKRFGLEQAESSSRGQKRARVDEDD
eukprot:TRINITY_DN7402_c0_g1_i2.p2 TRINITY_DN7402_c0_g1~~TRINITY_DN7402_c0_g1_i2.p2  ORF type:complete len:265 (+),score=62.87 TRINITY_DN7402_c0_g1_i2:1028-1822(+)